MASTPELTIDLGAIARNYAILKGLSGQATVAAVVKADAYGLGLAGVLPTLISAGCDSFFVATLDEAIAFRRLNSSVTLAVLNGPQEGEVSAFVEASLTPVINSRNQLKRWTATARKPIYLHIDTGMTRLGLEADDLLEIANDPDILTAQSVSLIMSHLACADQPDHPKNEAQRNCFDELRAELPAARSSLANSGGILLGPSYHYDLVRPGIALFGGNPQPGNENPFETVVEARAPILQIRQATANDTVGYGASRSLTRESRIATLAIGYADGIFRSMGDTDERGDGTVDIEGHIAPIVGQISMDLLSIDVTDIPEGLAHEGAMATLIGGGAGLDNVASSAGTISYEILTSLGNRYRRKYLNG